MNTFRPLARSFFHGIAVSSLFLAGLIFDPALVRASGYYDEPFRPQYHFSPEKNWINDPNGLVFYDGEYHLFYQYNPFGDKWGHMSWGHAESPDLLHWKHLPVALPEADGIMIFSGSAVVDWNNTSGFGRAGQPPLVAIYTGHYTSKPLQNEQIAFSTDHGRTWTKYSGNPVLDIGERDFRDPKVRWHEGTKHWVMTVAWPAHHEVRFYSSPDLKTWTHLSDFGGIGDVEGAWECPDLFPLAVGRATKWVLVVNVGSGTPAGGSGTQYFVGDFDGRGFTLDPSYPKGTGAALWADYGPDFYAAVSWSDLPRKDGRRLWLGWMSNWRYAGDVPTSPWRGAMSIPRELSLRETPEGLRLFQAPVRELKSLRGRRHAHRRGRIEEANAWLRREQVGGHCFEIKFNLDLSSGGQQGLKLLEGPGQETVVGVDMAENKLFLDRRRSGNVSFHPGFSALQTAPLPLNRQAVAFHLFVDACSVEVFVDDGQRVMTDLVLPDRESRGMEFFGPTEGTVTGLEFWPLESTWR